MVNVSRRLFARISLSAIFVLACGCEKMDVAKPSATAPQSAPAQSITVFAAASTVDVMNEAARLFMQTSDVEVKCSFDSSSTLAKQIITGGPADLFISADEKWMNQVEKAGAIDAKSRINLLGNQLVLIAPSSKLFKVTMEKGFDLASALPADARIALADPTHVPAGRYAKQSLEWLGWWATVESHMVAAQDVRAALRLVESGEADAGIVYSTDARAAKNSMVIAAFPLESHEPIRYPMALTAHASPQAADFAAYLQSPAMRSVFEKAGFTVLPRDQ